jgi:hypothetical protein
VLVRLEPTVRVSVQRAAGRGILAGSHTARPTPFADTAAIGLGAMPFELAPLVPAMPSAEHRFRRPCVIVVQFVCSGHRDAEAADLRLCPA